MLQCVRNSEHFRSFFTEKSEFGAKVRFSELMRALVSFIYTTVFIVLVKSVVRIYDGFSLYTGRYQLSYSTTINQMTFVFLKTVNVLKFIPSSFDRTLCVSKAFKFKISTSGTQSFSKMWRLTGASWGFSVFIAWKYFEHY